MASYSSYLKEDATSLIILCRWKLEREVFGIP